MTWLKSEHSETCAVVKLDLLTARCFCETCGRWIVCVNVMLGDVHWGGCQVLLGRAGFSPQPSTQAWNHLQRSQTRKVYQLNDFDQFFIMASPCNDNNARTVFKVLSIVYGKTLVGIMNIEHYCVVDDFQPCHMTTVTVIICCYLSQKLILSCLSMECRGLS